MKYIPNEAWDHFKNQYISDELSDIAQGIVTTLVLIIPNARVEAFKKGKLFTKMREDYYDLVRQYTDVKITHPENINMSIVTKEDFKRNHKEVGITFFDDIAQHELCKIRLE